MLIRYNFSVEGGPSIFNDCISMEQSEWGILSDQDIENLKMERFNNWLASLTCVPEELEE